ncbi:uncharacterized protein MONBRDRAFT_10902 [Monosiga brevicollis MX1]|uniref:Uncharacterized protein n=1 Tax=Monosiga brevicollis TaxID=81824 RepID=A9V7K6_MONBE|nr:uncharacterized protein MONBRDRAFT_10902 [Monosiga brevicollis MX1]EDQ86532.1 predicted protein [Monosiga brevicollis MX1]|eukprot:XP_001748645.1 hypothetical protein [Monosiga brevicollis MX1]
MADCAATAPQLAWTWLEAATEDVELGTTPPLAKRPFREPTALAQGLQRGGQAWAEQCAEAIALVLHLALQNPEEHGHRMAHVERVLTHLDRAVRARPALQDTVAQLHRRLLHCQPYALRCLQRTQHEAPHQAHLALALLSPPQPLPQLAEDQVTSLTLAAGNWLDDISPEQLQHLVLLWIRGDVAALQRRHAALFGPILLDDTAQRLRHLAPALAPALKQAPPESPEQASSPRHRWIVQQCLWALDNDQINALSRALSLLLFALEPSLAEMQLRGLIRTHVATRSAIVRLARALELAVPDLASSHIKICRQALENFDTHVYLQFKDFRALAVSRFRDLEERETAAGFLQRLLQELAEAPDVLPQFAFSLARFNRQLYKQTLLPMILRSARREAASGSEQGHLLNLLVDHLRRHKLVDAAAVLLAQSPRSSPRRARSTGASRDVATDSGSTQASTGVDECEGNEASPPPPPDVTPESFQLGTSLVHQAQTRCLRYIARMGLDQYAVLEALAQGQAKCTQHARDTQDLPSAQWWFELSSRCPLFQPSIAIPVALNLDRLSLEQAQAAGLMQASNLLQAHPPVVVRTSWTSRQAEGYALVFLLHVATAPAGGYEWATKPAHHIDTLARMFCMLAFNVARGRWSEPLFNVLKLLPTVALVRLRALTLCPQMLKLCAHRCSESLPLTQQRHILQRMLHLLRADAPTAPSTVPPAVTSPPRP